MYQRACTGSPSLCRNEKKEDGNRQGDSLRRVRAFLGRDLRWHVQAEDDDGLAPVTGDAARRELDGEIPVGRDVGGRLATPNARSPHVAEPPQTGARNASPHETLARPAFSAPPPSPSALTWRIGSAGGTLTKAARSSWAPCEAGLVGVRRARNPAPRARGESHQPTLAAIAPVASPPPLPRTGPLCSASSASAPRVPSPHPNSPKRGTHADVRVARDSLEDAADHLEADVANQLVAVLGRVDGEADQRDRRVAWRERATASISGFSRSPGGPRQRPSLRSPRQAGTPTRGTDSPSR